MNERFKNKHAFDTAILVGLIVVNAIFLVYWGVLAYYSQLHYDDLHFLWKMREMSIFDYIKDMYFSRSGRFVGYAVNGVVSVITNTMGFHQLWAMLYYAVGLGICWLVVKDFKLSAPPFGLFMGVCFLYNLYILSNIDFPVFYWLCAMPYYLFFPMACLLLKYLNEDKLTWWQWSILVILIVLIGGGNEAFTPIVLLLMFVNGLYLWHSKDWVVKSTWGMPQVKRIVWAAVAMLLLFAIVVVAPGNYERMTDTSQFIHPSGALGWVKALAKAVGTFFYFMAFYAPYILVVFSLAYYIGGKVDDRLPTAKWKLIMMLSLGFVVYLALSSMPNVYLYNGFGIQRNYTHVVFALLLTIVLIGYIMGVGRQSNVFGWVSILGLAFMVVIMTINIVIDTPTARSYGKATDERIEYLCTLRDNGQTETVVVDSLPVPYTEDAKHFVMNRLGKSTPMSVLYYISDADTIPNEYEYHMKRVLNLGFDFVVAKDDAHN